MFKKALVSKIELAKILSISTRSVDHLVQRKQIKSVRIGRRRVYDIDDVVADLKAGSASPEKQSD